MKKTIIITGATSGIGKALASRLAANGNDVFAVGRKQDALTELTDNYPENINAITADITKATDRLKIERELPSNKTGIYLIHNAGIAVPAMFTDFAEKDWDNHYRVNTKAPIFLTKLLLPYLKNGGRVLNISTSLAHKTLPGFSAYGITKAAFYMMKEFCNAELLERGVAFGSAMPGIVDTPIQDKIRTISQNKVPTVKLFEDFKNRDELLSPETAAKFLSWLLIESSRDEFIKGDWDIYDESHHHHWASPGDIKERQN